MPVGDCQRAFVAAALADGLHLSANHPPPLTMTGHLSAPAGALRDALREIFRALDGDELALARGNHGPLRFDAFHPRTGTAIEVDELQHFTSWRLITLSSYPASVSLGFELDEYRRLCREWSTKADRYRASKTARGFPTTERSAQRAYFDAVRDLVMPALGHPAVIRIPALDGDGRTAYSRNRTSIREALEPKR